MAEWERLPDEPVKWYVRFEAYRLAGPNRSLLGVFNADQVKEGKKRAMTPPASWRDALVKWDWIKRAEAWDLSEQARITAEKEAYRRGLPDEFDAKYRIIYDEAFKAWLRSLENAETEMKEMVEVPEIVRDAEGQPSIRLTKQNDAPV